MGAEGEHGAVAAGHPAEVDAALRTLADGGNAVDAAVAGAFCAFVVEPNNAGPAGYGHLTAWLPQERRFLSVDHGPRAPAAARPDMFALSGPYPVDRYSWPAVVGRANELGALATGVPGAVAGLCAAHERAGRLPLAQVVEPAIELCAAGLPVDWHLALTIVARLGDIRDRPAARAHLLCEGDPPAAVDDWGNGGRLELDALGATLRRIARDGAAGFHEGPLADALERELRTQGGILTARDLADYRPRVVWEEPTAFAGFRLATAEDDLGHLVFGLLDRLGLAALDPGSADALHLLAEAFGHAFADGMCFAGDPAEVPELSAALRSPAYAAARSATIARERAAERPIAAGEPRGERAGGSGLGGTPGTTQVAVADADGGMAVVITTIGQDFGGLVYVPEVGTFTNSAMANFDPRPGLVNSIAPGRMPLFGVPAVIAVDGDGRAVLACGGSGGYRITSGVVHATANVLAHGLAAEAAVAAPRVWCQGEETFVDARIPAPVLDELARRGHRVVRQELTPAWEPFARVSLVTADAAGVLSAASDPSWHAAAGCL